jgi:hypothetical protein
MRPWLALAALVLGLVPGPAVAQVLTPDGPGDPRFARVDAHPAECARLARQIAHFAQMQKRAHDLGNDMWEQRMGNQVDLLRGMQAGRCPDDVPVDQTAEALKLLLKLAAKAAITYFTFGAAGF